MGKLKWRWWVVMFAKFIEFRSTSVCSEDWLEMYVMYRDGTDRFLGRYCGFTAPGPVESPRGAVGIRVVLHTDQENVASGFKARYIFEVAKSVFGDCGGNFTSLDSGIITSPGYPSNYEGPGKGLASKACNWYVTARAGYKIFLNFELFGVEGDPASKLNYFSSDNAFFQYCRCFRSWLCRCSASPLAFARLGSSTNWNVRRKSTERTLAIYNTGTIC